jgi:DNA polymerase III sliding clamp (beta) subunit (PCNA family)
MKVKIEDLKNVLKILKPGLSNGKETTDQSNMFAFQDGMAFTYNDDISVRTPLPIKKVKGAVSAKELQALISKLKGDECDVEFTDNELLIKNGKIKAGIRLEAEIHMPIEEIKIPKPDKFMLLPEKFDKILRSVVFSTSKDMSREILTVINCDQAIVESTDSERATQCDLDKDYFSTPILIPAEAAKPLISYGKIIAYAVNGGWLHFDLDGTSVFSCRTMAGKFPELDELFVVNGQELVFPAEIKDMMDRAGIFIEADFDQEKLVEISISDKGVLKVRAEGDSGWLEESMRVKHSGSAIQFNINPQYLIQILSTVDKGIVSDNRILFESDSFRHVVALEVVE